LAAPELDSADRALAYLRTTVNNLCLNQIRATGSRPNLVAIDSETTQERLAEISAEAHIPFDTTLAAAEDASIIREALSRLSADQRTALVMWEMEGRSTEEIAKALGTKPENVRHIVGRARASFVRVLTEWVIDEATGTTALEALSTQYKKAAELAKKSSKVALSLLIVLVAFLGFNSVTGQDNVSSIISSATTTQEVPAATTTKSAAPSASATPSETAQAATAKAETLATSNQTIDIKSSTKALIFEGLDANGVPTGFTVANAAGENGTINVSKSTPVLTNEGLVLHSNTMTTDNAAINILLSQDIIVGGNGTSYDADASITMDGNWIALEIANISSNFERTSDGNYLLTAVISVNKANSSDTIIPASRGVDSKSAPSQITTVLLLNPGKTQILGQAIYVA
ncbi:MAG: sigma-70 family RNA polymerase sigma factor, partial [Actinobacteria bacterium]|nr:sigma-70 family RNA polymerase sigma factor [Actinomycetota bacterium]